MTLESRQHKQPLIIRLGAYTLMCILLLSFVKSAWFNNPTIISPIPDEKSKTNVFLRFFKKEKNPETLKERIKRTVNNEWTNYSVVVKDMHSDFTVGINESLIYDAASVNKVPILIALYNKAGKNEIDLSDVITVQEADVQDYGTGKIRYDTAAYILGNYTVGLPFIQSYIETFGLTQTDIVNNKTSNKDMATLFKALYDKKITTPALSDELLGMLKDSDFEDRLPAKLPKSATVYHKIGTGIGGVHDAGIVEDGSTAYYIGIFTSDITDEEQAAELLSTVSKTVYDFMYEK
jgi:beta-lactamase class A